MLYLATEQGLSGAPLASPDSCGLDAYLELLGGTGLPWAVSVAGGDLGHSDVARYALQQGGHLHLGLEFYFGDRTPTNVALVTEAVVLSRAEGREPAPSAQAVDILG